MALFEKPEVVILKESSDAKAYLEKLTELSGTVPQDTSLAQKIEKEIAITKAGIFGEEQIMFELKNSGMNLVVLHDIFIEAPGGNAAQIDYLVITPYVNIVIECKNLFGNIEINNRGDFIRTIEYANKRFKEGIYSPVTQNERHLQVLKECRKAEKGVIMGAIYEKTFEKYNRSLIVLANPKTVVNDRYAPAAIKKQVIRVDQLINTLKSMTSDVKTSKKDMRTYGEKLLSMNNENRKDYFTKFESLQKELEESRKAAEVLQEKDNRKKDVITRRFCPKCGKELVKRTAQKGDRKGKQFWGCSGFPNCRYVENIEDTTV